MVEITEVFAGQQGEGADVGRTTIFIRFFRCQLNCDFCDVKDYEPEDLPIDDILKKVKSFNNIKHITFTGGSPGLYQKEMELIMDALPQYKFSVETNGLVFMNPTKFHYVSVSPKKQKFNITSTNRYKKYPNVFFKFVITNIKDYMFWIKFIKTNKIPNEKVYMMPEGVSPEKIKSMMLILSDLCIKDGYNVSPRMHILIHGNKMGV